MAQGPNGPGPEWPRARMAQGTARFGPMGFAGQCAGWLGWSLGVHCAGTGGSVFRSASASPELPGRHRLLTGPVPPSSSSAERHPVGPADSAAKPQRSAQAVSAGFKADHPAGELERFSLGIPFAVQRAAAALDDAWFRLRGFVVHDVDFKGRLAGPAGQDAGR